MTKMEKFANVLRSKISEERKTTDLFGWTRIYGSIITEDIKLHVRYTLNSDVEVYYDDLGMHNGMICIHANGYVEKHKSTFESVNAALGNVERMIEES